MNTRTSLLVLGLAGAVLFGPAAPVSAALDRCQKLVSKEVLKLERRIARALTLCADLVQAQVQKNKPIADVSTRCDRQLSRAVDAANGQSAISKALVNLRKIGPAGNARCSDSDLLSLGHLPENPFGDRWTRLAAIAAWQTAWENAVFGNATLVNAIQALVEAAGCPLCSLVRAPPCRTQVCSLAAGSGGTTNGFAFAFSGAAVAGGCDMPSIMPVGEFAAVTAPQQGILPIAIGGGIFVCVNAFRGVGVTNCGGTFPTVDTDVCTDHIVDEGGDECETAAGTAQFCAPDVVEGAGSPHPGVTNGGPCLTLTTGAPATGATFLLITSRIQIILPSQKGADGVPCTADDTPASVARTMTLAQTTGTATSRVIDPNDNAGAADLTAGPTGGMLEPDCGAAASGDLSDTSVNAFSALHSVLGLDQVAESSLICQ